MHSFTVCIPAAGSGSRMKSESPKQYLTIADAPILYHTLMAFDSLSKCKRIIIATDDREQTSSVLGLHDWQTEIVVVLGGEQRSDSVEKALSAIEDDIEIVLVHDAARPCVQQKHIIAVVDAIVQHGAAILAVPSRDTLKEVENGMILQTVDRERVWFAQTPQGARAGLLREAFGAARKVNFVATDEASLLERIGVQVRIVEGSTDNIKITVPEDIIPAEAILLSRLQQQGHR